MRTRLLITFAALVLIAGTISFLVKADREWTAQVEIQAEQRRVADRQVAALEERRKADEMRKEQEAIQNASDEALQSLIKNCEDAITQKIQTGKKPVFAVDFPNYDATDLEHISEAAIAMRMLMGRPGTTLERSDLGTNRIAWLRKFPLQPVHIVAESASDSFSGVKQWAAVFDCKVKGLRVDGITEGQKYFFE